MVFAATGFARSAVNHGARKSQVDDAGEAVGKSKATPMENLRDRFNIE